LRTPNKEYFLHWSVGTGLETFIASTATPWNVWEEHGERAKFVFHAKMPTARMSVSGGKGGASSASASLSSSSKGGGGGLDLDDNASVAGDVTEDDFDALLNQLRFDVPGGENDSFGLGIDPFGGSNLPVCSACSETIRENRLDAFGMHWHKNHLACAICQKNFLENDVPVVEGNDGNAYCEKDFLEKFAPKCSKCNKPIQGKCTNAISRQWHPTCFTCTVCEQPFRGRFFERDSKPYCEKHYYDSMGLICPTCERPIIGKCVNAKGKRYHPQHFICSHCRTKLTGTGYFVHDEKLFCKSCSVIFYG